MDYYMCSIMYCVKDRMQAVAGSTLANSDKEALDKVVRESPLEEGAVIIWHMSYACPLPRHYIPTLIQELRMATSQAGSTDDPKVH